MNLEIYMRRCLELAAKGIGLVEPNPLVGCVIVKDNQVIGEGFHHQYGGAHAEVNAINNVKNKEDLKHSTLFVNLEPCAHFGKTPPCADLILEYKVPRVVICNLDPFKEVAGKGIKKLMNAGVDVRVGILEKEGRYLNRRFFTFHEKNRPYVLLKWAQSPDGFIWNEENSQISNSTSQLLVHRWRTEEMAIMVGTNTALADNPKLTARLFAGRNPIRIIIDKHLRLKNDLHLFDGEAPTLLITEMPATQNYGNTTVVSMPQAGLDELLKLLYEKKILSVMVEGGEKLLTSFIQQGLWDEARVFIGNKALGKGINAPKTGISNTASENIGNNSLLTFYNPEA